MDETTLLMKGRRAETKKTSTKRPLTSVDWKLVLLIFPLFLSVDLFNISFVLDYCFNAWKIFSFLVLTYLYFKRFLKRAISIQIVILISLILFLIISTLLNEGSISRLLVVWGGFLAVAFVVECFLEDSPREILQALKVTLVILTTLNFITVLMYPDGIWSTSKDLGYGYKIEGYWLFGHRNNFGMPILAALFIYSVYDLKTTGRLSIGFFLLSIEALLSVLLTQSASSIVVTIIAIAISLFVDFKFNLKMFNPFVLLGSYVLIDISIVIFNIQKVFAGFIETVLHRSADLTGRTEIWQIVISKLHETPILGHGIQMPENNGLTVYNTDYVHAHNAELDILYNSGLAGLLCYIVLLAFAAFQCNRYYDDRTVQLAFWFLFLTLVHGITGLFFSSYAILILWCCIKAECLASEE